MLKKNVNVEPHVNVESREKNKDGDYFKYICKTYLVGRKLGA